MSVQPIEIWSHNSAPNPWKVRIILDELSLPYTVHDVDFPEAKSESYLKICPNGRLPAIRDPNTGLTLWESDAIILYLVDQYDRTGKISYKDGTEKHLSLQWIIFQASGQGPYFGQLAWFAKFHSEKLPSAIDRYVKEIERVTAVLDKAVSYTGWLVGDRCTFVDLSFVNWAMVARRLFKELGKEDELKKFPNHEKWIEKMSSRESVRYSLDSIREARLAQGLSN
ncbi:glutathione S-transferase [Viridothelium virens]|uniref:Glutathione S-transferase n=1 Tax=Viridothelium virens TaxID=1048519 RepID=A0A6A6HIR0_VIRVR|nr:glutathione S-transferase [Viridothelium virens]